MAYLALDHELTPRCLEFDAARKHAVRAGLQPADRTVLRLSLRDPRSSLARPGALRTRALRLFGLGAPNALADPRLEALRRFGILFRCKGDRLSPREEDRLRAAGYTSDAVAEARGLVWREARQRAAPHRRIGAAVILVVLAAQLMLCRFLSAYLEDGLLGLLGTLMASAMTVAPLRTIWSLVSGGDVARAA